MVALIGLSDEFAWLEWCLAAAVIVNLATVVVTSAAVVRRRDYQPRSATLWLIVVSWATPLMVLFFGVERLRHGLSTIGTPVDPSVKASIITAPLGNMFDLVTSLLVGFGVLTLGSGSAIALLLKRQKRSPTIVASLTAATLMLVAASARALLTPPRGPLRPPPSFDGSVGHVLMACVAVAIAVPLFRRARDATSVKWATVTAAVVWLLGGIGAFAATRAMAHDAAHPPTQPRVYGVVGYAGEPVAIPTADSKRCEQDMDMPRLQLSKSGEWRYNGGLSVLSDPSELQQRLNRARKLWEEYLPNKTFPGKLMLEVPASAPPGRAQPMLQAAVDAGYDRFAVLGGRIHTVQSATVRAVRRGTLCIGGLEASDHGAALSDYSTWQELYDDAAAQPASRPLTLQITPTATSESPDTDGQDIPSQF